MPEAEAVQGDSAQVPIVVPPALPEYKSQTSTKPSKRVKASRRPPPPNGNGLTPYLDVMTISSCKHPSQVDKSREKHTRLLHEPIAIPDLRHTGVKASLKSQDYPLFYPSGSRNNNLRNTIQHSLRHAINQDMTSKKSMRLAGWDSSTHSDITTSLNSSLMKNSERKKVLMRKTKSDTRIGHSQSISEVGIRISGVRSPDRKLDHHTKDVLKNLRANSDHLQRLLGLSSGS